jgi:hypothetical protein
MAGTIPKLSGCRKAWRDRSNQGLNEGGLPGTADEQAWAEKWRHQKQVGPVLDVAKNKTEDFKRELV